MQKFASRFISFLKIHDQIRNGLIAFVSSFTFFLALFILTSCTPSGGGGSASDGGSVSKGNAISASSSANVEANNFVKEEVAQVEQEIKQESPEYALTAEELESLKLSGKITNEEYERLKTLL